MSEYRWAHIRETAIAKWGTIPQGQLEADIIEIFENSPTLVIATIEKLTTAFNQGNIHSPWAVLRSDLQKRMNPQRAAIATDHNERDKAITRAEAWIRSTGIHYPTETEILNHLFGTDETTPPLEWLEQHEHDTRGNPGRPLYEGLLKATITKTRAEGPQPVPPSAGSPPLAKWRTTKTRDRILELWRQHRHEGNTIDQEADERADAWKKSHAAAQQLATFTPPERAPA